MLSQRLSRAWSFIKSAPIVLLAVATAIFAVQVMRRAREKALQAARIRDAHAAITLPTPAEQAQQIDRQLESTRAVITHTQAATRARRLADAAATRIETAGHPSVAELVRSWNRE